MEMSPSILDAFDQAGRTLAALDEEVVLFAYYRAGPGSPSARFSVRLEIPGSGSSVQESAPIPATALARAFAAREAKCAALAEEETLRRELAERRSATATV
jgi:hypothetical protein